ncbi:restriction endonuclease subunit S [Corynebacterium vitaeruminis]|nr:restriction endonuclease subunit S [Corynebacterium vitaeruminis]
MRELVQTAIGGGWGAEDPSESESTKVRVIRGADFPNAREQVVSSAPVRWESPSRASSRILEPGDIVLEISGGTRVRPTGRAVFITEKMVGASPEPLIPASFCRKLHIDSELVEPEFVYYWLQNMHDQGRAWSYQNQSTGIANFKFESFLDEEIINLPNRTTQTAIVQVLRSLDDKIAANNQIVRCSIELCSALIDATIGGGTVPLSDVAEVNMGTSPKGEFLNETGDGKPFFQGVRDFGKLFPSNRVFTQNAVRVANSGDILFAVRAPIGQVNIANEDCAIGRGVAAIRGKEHHLTLFYLLLSHQEIWDIFQDNGTVFASINRADLNGAPIPWPSDPARTEKTIAPIHARAMEALRENEVLASTRDELLPLLMSGKITVAEASESGMGNGVEGMLEGMS